MIRIALFRAPTEIAAELPGRLYGAELLLGRSIPHDCDAVVAHESATFRQPHSLPGKRLFLIIDDALITQSIDDAVTVINPDRYLPKHQAIRQQLDAGKLGQLGLLRLHRWGDGGFSWRDLDLVLWYFGMPPDVVFVSRNIGCTQTHLGFPGGGMALLDHTLLLDHAGHRDDRSTYYSVSLICSHGAAYADDHADAQLAFGVGAPRAIRFDSKLAQWTTMLQAIVGMCANERTPATFPTWNDVQALSAAIAKEPRGVP
jgi:hypothetical protein